MKKNPTSQSGLFNPRVLLAFTLCSVGVLLGILSLAATPLANPLGDPSSANLQGDALSGGPAAGVPAGATDWAKFRYDLANSGFNPYENVIGPSNVSGLTNAWTGTVPQGQIQSSPAVANGVVYIASLSGQLCAFSASGTTGCSGIPGMPKTCNLLWAAFISGAAIESSPAVANGVVYVGSLENVGDGKLYAFRADTGVPLWTGATGGPIHSSPAVANGVVYVGSNDGNLYAFSAAGTTNCSGTPTICTPLWTAATGNTNPISSSPAVADGVVYVTSQDGHLYAFSATGTTNCSGTPTTCTPLWTAATGQTVSSPAVANGMVYVGDYSGILYAFSAAGITNCSGTPKTCTPLWTGAATGIAPDHAFISSPAVANGVVYVGSYDFELYAFSAAGTTNCSGTPTTCTPLWTAATGGKITSSPAVANEVVYVGSSTKLYAFSAAGTTNCSGTPTTCTPLWTGATGDSIVSSPAVANGVVYVGSSDGKLYAFSLPLLTGAVSRMTHGSAGTFDIDLPLTGTRGVECRSSASLGAGNYTIVFNFVNTVTSCGMASTSAGSVSSSSSGPNGNQCTVNLTGVSNAQYITVTLTGVLDSQANTGNVSATMGVLIGDVNATGLVDGNDVSAVQGQVRQTADSTNFRLDVNATGLIDGNDVSLVQSKTRTSLPFPP